jgi:hypothetical protein
LNQANRVYSSFESYQASIGGLIDVGTVRVTPEMERPAAVFWSDVHFLMIAVNHLEGALQKLDSGGPRLDKALGAKAVELRHLLERWEKAEQGRGARKGGYLDKHGQHAGPSWV